MQIGTSASLPLQNLSLRARGRWHTGAFVLIAFWAVAGAGINLASAAGAPLLWWDLIHPFTVGVITTSILVYSTHFAEALTRTPAAGYRAVAARVALVQVGLVLLLAGRVGAEWTALADAAATLIVAALLWHLGAIARALRGSLAGSFAVTVPYYLAATAFLIGSVACAFAAGRELADYAALITAHQHAALWGFVWLTIVGTIVTLLPTLAEAQISATARRRCLGVLAAYCVGLAVALAFYGAGLNRAAGIAQLASALAAAGVVIPVVATALRGGQRRADFAPVSVLLGLAWLSALNAGDGLAAALGAAPRATIYALAPALIGAGLIQMITGVTAHLVPVLRGGGPGVLGAAKAKTTYAGPARLVLINFGAVTCVAGMALPGIIMVGIGLAGNVAAIISSFRGSAPAHAAPIHPREEK